MNHHKTTIFITQKPTKNHQNPTSFGSRNCGKNRGTHGATGHHCVELQALLLGCSMVNSSLLGIVGIFHPKWGYVISKDGNIMGISWKCQRFF